MSIESKFIATLDKGAILDISLEEHIFRVYIAQRPADIEQVAQIVPAQRFEEDGDVHVAAISSGAEAAGQIQDLLFNLNPGDTMVFLCTNPEAYSRTMAEFGQLAGNSTQN